MIRERTARDGYRMSLQRLTTLRTKAAMDLLMPRKDTSLGIIFVGLMSDTMIQLFMDTGFPVVCVDYWGLDPRADAIVVDCYGEGAGQRGLPAASRPPRMFCLSNGLGGTATIERESDSELFLAGMQRALQRAGLLPMPPDRIRFQGNGSDAAQRSNGSPRSSRGPRPGSSSTMACAISSASGWARAA